VFRYPPLGASRGLAGREVLPSARRAGDFSRRRATCLIRRRSWGSTLRRFTPTSGWSRRATCAAAESRRAMFSGISVRPGPRAVRARPSHSRFIFVGMIGRRLETRVNQKGGRSRDQLASTSGLRSRLRSDSPAHVRPRDRSCLGLRLLQGCRAHCCASEGRARPRTSTDHQPPETHGPLGRVAAHPQSAHGFEASFPTEMTHRIESCSKGFTSLLRRMLPARIRRPFSVLMGLMPCFSRLCWSRASSLSEVLHRP